MIISTAGKDLGQWHPSFFEEGNITEELVWKIFQHNFIKLAKWLLYGITIKFLSIYLPWRTKPYVYIKFMDKYPSSFIVIVIIAIIKTQQHNCLSMKNVPWYIIKTNTMLELREETVNIYNIEVAKVLC